MNRNEATNFAMRSAKCFRFRVVPLRVAGWFAIAVLLVANVTGCQSLAWWQKPPTENAPIVFSAVPTLDEIVRVVNSNSAPIRQLHAEGASVSAAGYPPLRANLELERPRRFRLRASLIGPELDLGSNDEQFWFWLKHSPQPAVYFARHDQFARSPNRALMPIDPSWLAEALGVVYLDPTGKFEGPVPAGDHRLQIRWRGLTPEGEQSKVIVIHDQYGWILEEHLYDPRGQLAASARMSQHRRYPAENVTLPHRVELQIPSSQMTLSIHAHSYQINQLYGDPNALWSMPRIEGYTNVDIATPGLQLSPVTYPAGANIPPAPQAYSAPRASNRLPQRGFPTQR